jgi:asparagine synthetase B (glutamine-hydrolysing)
LLVARLAHSDVKVALSADGGDELFGGYVNYSTIPNKIRALERVPAPLRRFIGQAMKSRGGAALTGSILGMYSRGNFDKSEDRVRKLSEALLSSDGTAVFELAVSYTTPKQVQQLLGTRSELRPSLDVSSVSLEEAMMSWDFHHYLPGDILVKVDRMTMRVGLEESHARSQVGGIRFACPPIPDRTVGRETFAAKRSQRPGATALDRSSQAGVRDPTGFVDAHRAPQRLRARLVESRFLMGIGLGRPGCFEAGGQWFPGRDTCRP